jgi:hypothetical protein
MMAVAAHPRILRYAGKLSLPMTLRRLAKSIMKHITWSNRNAVYERRPHKRFDVVYLDASGD